MKPGEPGFEEWVQSFCDAEESNDDSDGESILSEHQSENLLKRTRCATCPRSKNKKTVTACYKCLKPVCGDCRKCVCIDCAE